MHEFKEKIYINFRMFPKTFVTWIVDLLWLPFALKFRVINLWWLPFTV